MVYSDPAVFLSNYAPYFTHESLSYTVDGLSSRSIPLDYVLNLVINKKTFVFNTKQLFRFLESIPKLHLHFEARIIKMLRHGFRLLFTTADTQSAYLTKQIINLHTKNIKIMSHNEQNVISAGNNAIILHENNRITRELKLRHNRAFAVHIMYKDYLERKMMLILGQALLPPIIGIIVGYATRSNENAYCIDRDMRKMIDKKQTDVADLEAEIKTLDNANNTDDLCRDYIFAVRQIYENLQGTVDALLGIQLTGEYDRLSNL